MSAATRASGFQKRKWTVCVLPVPVPPFPATPGLWLPYLTVTLKSRLRGAPRDRTDLGEADPFELLAFPLPVLPGVSVPAEAGESLILALAGFQLRSNILRSQGKREAQNLLEGSAGLPGCRTWGSRSRERPLCFLNLLLFTWKR